MNFNAMKDLVIDGWIILKGSSFIPNKAKTTSNLFFMISLRNMLMAYSFSALATIMHGSPTKHRPPFNLFHTGP